MENSSSHLLWTSLHSGFRFLTLFSSSISFSHPATLNGITAASCVQQNQPEQKTLDVFFKMKLDELQTLKGQPQLPAPQSDICSPGFRSTSGGSFLFDCHPGECVKGSAGTGSAYKRSGRWTSQC